METYIRRGELQVAGVLDTFITTQALPGTGVDADTFWNGFAQLLATFVPRNEALLNTRTELQEKIDAYHRAGKPIAGNDYREFLRSIGYLASTPDDVTITTTDVDEEIASVAGPQLVVPINNARYALNACNARWGSLYDALYGTDVISEDNGAQRTSHYNPVRGQQVVKTARKWLDVLLPLSSGSHVDSVGYNIHTGKLAVELASGEVTTLVEPAQWRGYQGDKDTPTSLLFTHQGLHFEIQLDPVDPIGKTDPAGVKDILLEAALTTIMDCEDSVAAVDAQDKTLVYQNWLGLMQGTLKTEMQKNGQTFTREMQPDRQYTSAAQNGATLTLPGRSLMFVRNVGHLMTSDAILYNDQPIPEGIMDGVMTALIGKHDLLGNSRMRNSRTGSIYIVKPKMHGPEEVAFTNELFSAIEDLLSLKRNTLKMGIMDEERRTSVNLKACIGKAAARVVFINTGFLDRTGDEIHTSMLAGPFADKATLKTMPWIAAYEKSNVATGLACGLSGKAQIGKGMWPIPDQMANMMQVKIGHPKAGANTAWVPSPTAATLHALHYHQVNVLALHPTLASERYEGLQEILTIPLAADPDSLDNKAVQRELENNIQGILGYVVRWVHQGIGCSKVPDINNVGLMEDRATLRISSQHIANWLAHGIVTAEQVDRVLVKMAALVDEQNAHDSEYIAMTPEPESALGFQAARDLIFKGKEQPNGYTEPLLHAKRREMKARLAL